MNQPMVSQDNVVDNNTWHFVKYAIGAACSTLALWFHSLPAFVQALLWTRLADVVLGMIRENPKTKKRRVYNFEKGWQSFRKKAAALILVGMASVLEKHSPTLEGLSSATAIFFVSHFGLSALNHAATLGVPMPPAIRDALSKMERETPTSATETEK
jgi:phage-related holin